MGKIVKLKAVRVLVRPDRRERYMACWGAYSRSASELSARAWLFEDQALPGRFMEFTEFEAAVGMEGKLEAAYREAKLGEMCVRREGDDIMYRQVAPTYQS